MKWTPICFTQFCKIWLNKNEVCFMLNPLYRFCLGSVTNLSSSKETELKTHVCKGGQCIG